MKIVKLCFLLLFLPLSMSAQETDSLAVRQEIDSLLLLYQSSLEDTDYERAEGLILEAKEVIQLQWTRNHADYLTVLEQLGDLYMNQHQNQKAIGPYLEIKEIKELTSDTLTPYFAEILNILGNLHTRLRQSEQAEHYYLTSLAIREQVLEKSNPQYIGSLINLGSLFMQQGRLEKAEGYLLQAKSVYEAHPDLQNHRFYMFYLQNIGFLYWHLSQYKKAAYYFNQTLNFIEKTEGKGNVQYAGNLVNLGSIYSNIDQFEQAESCFMEAMQFFEESPGMTAHRYYPNCLANFGLLYMAMGQFEKAEQIFQKEADLIEQSYGKSSSSYAYLLYRMGYLYSNPHMAQYDEAEPLFLEAIRLYEELNDTTSSLYLGSIGRLGVIYGETGAYAKAEQLIIEAIDRSEKEFGKSHINYPENSYYLGLLYQKMGQYDKALPWLVESQEGLENIMGKEHDMNIGSLYALGTLYAQNNQYESALPFLKDASQIQKSQFQKLSRFSTEQELAAYVKMFTDQLDLIFSLSQRFDKLPADLAALCYDQALFHKGFLLYASNAFRQNVIRDSAVQVKFDLWKSYQRRLGFEYSQPLAEKSNVSALEEKANRLEKELIQSVAGFEQAVQEVSWQSVQDVLTPGEAAIEFVHYQLGFDDTNDTIMYAAVLIRPDEVQPQFIPLFEQSSLEFAIESQTLQKTIAAAGRGIKPRKSNKSAAPPLDWQGLTEALEGISRIYFAPSGLLHRLNLGTVLVEDQKSFSELYALTQLNSTRQLAVPQTKTDYQSDALVYGGIYYDLDSTEAYVAQIQADQNSHADYSPAEMHIGYSDRSLRSGSWNYLEWTNTEAIRIQTLLGSANMHVETFSGHRATEESFQQIGQGKSSPRVLHLATHGFFFPDPKSNHSLLESASEPSFKISDHPMIRSGLVLAGANHVWQGLPPLQNREDGILTAYEISQMDLSHTELVVLSACETGLGDIEGNEGVYGLQRAFKIAGAKYLIMSLWQVPDKETMIFMETFYQYWLEEKMTIPEAFRATQKTMKQKKVDPIAWAAFVLVE